MTAEKKFWAITIVFAALFAYGVFNLFKPDIPPVSFVRGTVRELTPGVLLGPYPSESEMRRLKVMGVETVISLMDSSSKVETMLVSEGKSRAEENSMLFYNFPMNVIDMESEENMARLNEAMRLATNAGGGLVYVHCYLGRHRVGIFEREFVKAGLMRPKDGIGAKTAAAASAR